MIDASLLELVKEVRWKTLKLLEGVTDDAARFTPAGTNNHILWHAGHSLDVVEKVCCHPIVQHGTNNASGNSPPYPADWSEKFGWNSKPAAVTEWPALSDVVERLIDQRTRLSALVQAVPFEALDKIIGDPPRNRTLRGTIIHGLHDEAGHQGEIYLLKKLWNAHG